ncbi:MAG: ATP-binding protein [Limisphaerales bacterium]
MKVQAQLYVFGAAVALLAALVLGAGHSGWRELKLLRSNFATVRTESFHLAEQVEARVRGLTQIVLRFDARRSPTEQAAFEKQSHGLKQWLAAQHPFVTTPLERETLRQIESALETYVTNAVELMRERARVGAAPLPQVALDTMAEIEKPLLHLCEQLRAAEREALNQFVNDSYEAVADLQRHLLASVGLIALLGFAATRLLYRARIAPLRAQVFKSRTLLERQEKLASLGTLAAGVAHEIRNPLTAINVRVHGLKKALATGSSEREDVLVIDEEIRRLDRIVRDFLDFARPAAPRLITVQVESLFGRVRNLLGAQWQESGIRFEVDPPQDWWIRVDTQQLEQVLINLVQNAADSLEGAGRITLRARAATARLGGSHRSVVILEVVDTGKGIPPEVQQRIFDPFFTTRESGTGLGLAIAARIVDKHGGLLQCETQVGRGTTFGIVLARAEPVGHETHT